MAKSKTSSYILTLQLKTEKFQEDELNKRFEKCRKIYNSCITELFKRYNSGITSLQKEEIERAAYINDEITLTIYDELDKNKILFNKACTLYLPKSKFKAVKRDKLNVLLTKIRTLLSLAFYSYI